MNEEDLSKRLNIKIDKNKEKLIGWEFEKLKDFHPKNGATILLVYNLNDCHTCIDIGIELIESIQNIITHEKQIAYRSLCTSSSYQDDEFKVKLNNISVEALDGKVEVDSRFYGISSPIVLLLDNQSIVKESFNPLSGVDQSKEKNKFINRIKSLN